MVQSETKQLDGELRRRFPDAYEFAQGAGRQLRNQVEKTVKDAKSTAESYMPSIRYPVTYRYVKESLAKAPVAVRRCAAEVANKIGDGLGALDKQIKQQAPETHASIHQYLKKLQKEGVGHPWGTEYRRYIAALAGIEYEVDDLRGVVLNSIANSAVIKLKGDFIIKLKADPAVIKLDDEVKRVVINKIKSLQRKAELKTNYLFSHDDIERSTGFGGQRYTGDPMMTQLLHIWKFDKYKATWSVALNKLTWSLRNGKVKCHIDIHCVYNITGYAAVWKITHTINDKLDLRPRSGNKIDLNTDYNIVTSILGSAYHDIAGNTDKLRVFASWTSYGEAPPTKW